MKNLSFETFTWPAMALIVRDVKTEKIIGVAVCDKSLHVVCEINGPEISMLDRVELAEIIAEGLNAVVEVRKEEKRKNL